MMKCPPLPEVLAQSGIRARGGGAGSGAGVPAGGRGGVRAGRGEEEDANNGYVGNGSKVMAALLGISRSACSASPGLPDGAGWQTGLVTPPGPEFELGTDGPSLILVGVDGSRTSLRAAAYAAGLARRQHARLLAVYVTKLPASVGVAPGAAGALAEAASQVASDLERQFRDAATQFGLDLEFRSVYGDPWTELNRAATEAKADAVVVGASEHAGHRIIGSLATRLVRAGKWPVTVVP